MPKRTKSHEDSLLERLRDSDDALTYLQAALADDEDEHSDAVFLLALRNVAKAHQMTHVAENAGLSRESLYKSLSSNGNPSLSSIRSVLNAIGLELSVRKAEQPTHQRETASETIESKAS